LVVGCWFWVWGWVWFGFGFGFGLGFGFAFSFSFSFVRFLLFMAMILELECSDQIMCGYVSATSMEDDELLLLVALVVGIGMVPFLAAVITGKKNACCIASFAVTRNAWS